MVSSVCDVANSSACQKQGTVCTAVQTVVQLSRIILGQPLTC